MSSAGHDHGGARVDLDDRFESSPAGAKLPLIIVLVAAMVVLALVSARRGYNPARHLQGLSRPTLLDGVVTAVLALWAVIGAGTPGDGHAALLRVDVGAVWPRLPALVLGVVGWLVVDRGVLPAVLGTRPRPFARVTAAGVLLLWCTAFDNGLPSGPWILTLIS